MSLLLVLLVPMWTELSFVVGVYLLLYVPYQFVAVVPGFSSSSATRSESCLCPSLVYA